MHLTAADAMSGVDKTYYSLDETTPSIVATAGTVVSAEGTTTLKYFSVDKAGNVEDVKSAIVRIDRAAPVTNHDAPPTWVGTPVTVHLTAMDAISGFGATRYSLNSGVATTYTPIGIAVSSEGTNTINFASVDTAGNWEATKTATVRIDYTAPVTLSNATTHYADTATITLSPSDAHSGISETHWRLDSGNWRTGNTVSTETTGHHLLEWYSVDAVGNVEATKSAAFEVLTRFDDTDPRLLYLGVWPTTYSSSLYRDSDRRIDATGTLNVAFEGSAFSLIGTKYRTYGIMAVSVDGSPSVDVDLYAGSTLYQQRLLSMTGLSEGRHTLTLSWTGRRNPASTGTVVRLDAIDVVGVLVEPDTTPPVTTTTAQGAWRTTPETVTLAATDNLAGVKNTYYRLGGGSVTTYTAAFAVSAEGTTTIEYWSVDTRSNSETTKTAFVKIDRDAPVSTDDAPSTWATGTVTVHLTSTDAVSGVDETYYSLDGSDPSLPYPHDGVTVSDDGTTTLRYKSTDTAGNTSAVKAVDVRVDKIAPVSSSNASSAWTSGTVAVELSATDSHSGVSAKEYSLDGAETLVYAGPVAISGDGVHTLKFRAVDHAGNRETTNTATVRIDDTAPVTTSNAQSLNTTSATISLSATDSASGPAATYWRLNNGTWQSGTSISVQVTGHHLLEWYSVDAVGNVEATKSAAFEVLTRFDDTDPRLLYLGVWPVTYSSSLYRDSDRRIDATGTLNVAFEGSAFSLIGTKYKTYGIMAVSVDGSPSVDVDLYAGSTLYQQRLLSMTGLSEGRHTLTLSWTGRRNPASTGTVVRLDAIDVVGVLVEPDTTPPVTTTTAQGAWRTTPETVTLAATDNLAGVKNTYYRLGGGSVTTYTAAFAVSAEGTTTIEYWSVDTRSNSETTKTAFVKIDRDAPVSTDDAPAAWATGTVTVHLTSTDAVSGVDETYYSLDGSDPSIPATEGTVVSSEGTTTLKYYSVDAAGNAEGVTTRTVRIDRDAPVSTDDAPSTWATGTVTVHLTSTDAVSGVDETYYSLDGSDPSIPATEGTVVSSEGTTTLKYYSVDAAGNAEGVTTRTVRIDRDAPVSTDDAPSTWATGTVTVHLTSTDAVSGVDETYYSLDGSDPSLPYPHDGVTVSDDGTTTLRYKSTDTAGNTSAVKAVDVRVDKIAPVSSSNASSAWTSGTVAVELSATDSHSGVSAKEYSLDGAETLVYAGPVAISGDGVHTLKFRAVDHAGNRETTNTATVRIDDTAPVTTSNAQSLNTTSATISLSATDSASGPAATYWRLNNGTWQSGTSISVQVTGHHLLEWYSVDAVGNVEATKSAAFEVLTRFDDTDPRLLYLGVWPVTYSSSLYRDSDRRIDATGTLNVAFEGSAFSLIGTKYKTYGIMAVSVDGSPSVDVDLYAGSTLYQQRLLSMTGLSEGRHTLTLSWTGRRNPASTGTVVRLDAIDVVGVLVEPDTTPPVTTTTAQGAWRTTPETVTLAATDNLAGVKNTYYRLGGGSVTTYTAAFAVSAEGTTTIEYWSVDTRSNSETTKTAFVKIDRDAPVSTDDAPSTWATGTVTVHLTSTDAVSGVDETYYSLDGSDPSIPATEGTVVSSEGTTTLKYYSVDAAGNAEGVTTRTVRIDRDAPVSTDDAPSTWATGTVTVHLTSTDAVSGVDETYYSLDGSDPSIPATEGTVVSSEGTTTLKYYSVDAAGNAEGVTTRTVRIDRDAPVSTDDAPSTWATGTVTVHLTSTDAVSGVDETYYSLDGSDPSIPATEGTVVSSEGTTTLKYYSVDAAGNAEGVTTRTVRIDRDAPVSTDDAPSTWATGTVTVHLTSTDAVSGVDETYYSLDGSDPSIPATEGTVVSSEGTTTLKYYSVDAAGNAEGVTTRTVRIDRDAPVSTDDAPAEWATGTVTVHLTSTDAVSGVDETYYSLDGSDPSIPATEGTVVSSEGTTTLKYYSVDAAGNAEGVTTRTVRIDRDAPVSTDDAPSDVGHGHRHGAPDLHRRRLRRG